MIQNLLARIIAVLQQALNGVLPSAASHVGSGPMDDPAANALPVVLLSPGKLDVAPLARDASSSEPRAQDFREELPVSAAAPLGPYSLAKTPLQTSMLCRAVIAKGTMDEHQALLIEGADYQIDYANARLSLKQIPQGASSLILRYAFAGVFTIQDFTQEFHLTAFAADYATVEQLAALSISVILTSRDDLLDFYNQTAPTTYTAGPFVSTHTISQLQALSGSPAAATNSGLKLDFTFRVLGQMKLVREAGGFALIQQIRSPGRTSGAPVDIDAGLG